MKNILLISVLFTLINSIGYSQILESFKDKNNKIGLKDLNGKVIVAPKYDNFYTTFDGKLDFSENDGLAAFEIAGKWVY